MAEVPPETLVEVANQNLEEGRILSVLKAGATATNGRLQKDYEHWMAIVDDASFVRVLSHPNHPATGRRLDLSYVPLKLAQAFVAKGHGNDPVPYRFLDHVRSSEVAADPGGVADALVAGAARHVKTDRLLGDYVHSMSAFIEDMWGDYVRGDAAAAWVVAREIAVGAVGLESDARDGRLPGQDEFPRLVAGLPAEDREGFEAVTGMAADVDADTLQALVASVRARGNVPYEENPQPGPTEKALLAEVEVIAKDLVARYGDDVLAVGATGSIGRCRATAGADYDVHVLMRPRSDMDRGRIDFRLYAPTYPGLPRRAELGFTPTSFLDAAIEHGVRHPFAYHHLDHVRHTLLVYDANGEGERYRNAVWQVRPPEGYVEQYLDAIAHAIPGAAALPPGARERTMETLADECAKLLLMRYGLGFVKPRYRSVNLDKIRSQEPEFFKVYDRVKGLDGLTSARALDAVRTATRLFEHALERAGVSYRYHCEEMDLVGA